MPSGEGGSRSGEVSAEHLHGGRGRGQYVSLGVDSGDKTTVLRKGEGRREGLRKGTGRLFSFLNRNG